MEGSIFVAGAAVKWLRDGLKLIGTAGETAAAAAAVPDDHGVYLVPAFVGSRRPALGSGRAWAHLRSYPGRHRRAPGTRRARVGRLQTLDLTQAMARDGAVRPAAIRIDGGMAGNDWFCQFLADMLDARVERPAELETTALGAAFLAGLATEVWKDTDALSATWRSGGVFSPRMAPARRARLAAGWQQAMRRTLLPE